MLDLKTADDWNRNALPTVPLNRPKMTHNSIATIFHKMFSLDFIQAKRQFPRCIHYHLLVILLAS